MKPRWMEMGRITLLAVLLWVLFSWPLPRYVDRGIPASDRNVEKSAVRAMIPGDHLQLLYQFGLFADMVRGDIPWFHNVYEFNAGCDADRTQASSFYFPFSFVYALADRLTTPALAWNLAQWLSIWLSAWFSWRLIGRFVSHPLAHALGWLVAVSFPYRWITLLTGSPSGFAMSLVPAVLYGVDVALRDERRTGALLAGVALFFIACVDSHALFFSVLVAPVWAVICVSLRADRWWRPMTVLRLLRTAVPLLLLAAAAVALVVVMTRANAGPAGGPRPLDDVVRYSPHAAGLLSWANLGMSNHVFIGAGSLVWLLLALAGVIAASRSQETRGLRRLTLCCLVGCAGVIIVALGMNGPCDGLAIRAGRRLIPRFEMIRQTVKIYCLLPPVLGLVVALASQLWLRALPLCRWVAPVVALLAAATVVEYRCKVRPTVCLLDSEQGAYAAVRADSEPYGEAPHALAIPLWPGDSHWSSLYQYYGLRHQVRMLNGYAPVINPAYYTNVFQRFCSINEGVLDESQVAALRALKVRYLVFHEDAFPEKVSAFPAGWTLRSLRENPRLALLANVRSVWSFRLEDSPPTNTVRSGVVSSQTVYPPARSYEGEQLAGPDCRRDDPACSRGGYAHIAAGGSVAVQAVAPNAPGIQWLVRLRGAGRLCWRGLVDGQGTTGGTAELVDAEHWAWRAFPVVKANRFGATSVELTVDEGALDFDVCLLAGGDWQPEMAEGEARVMRPADLFRGGNTDRESGAVRFSPRYDPADWILYGPRLPLAAPARYELSLELTTAATVGAKLGMVRAEVSRPGGVVMPDTPVVAGVPMKWVLDVEEDLPFTIFYFYSREVEVTVHAIRLTRLPRD